MERARLGADPTEDPPVRLLLSWVLSAVALLVAVWIVPNADRERLLGGAGRRSGDRHPERDPAAA